MDIKASLRSLFNEVVSHHNHTTIKKYGNQWTAKLDGILELLDSSSNQNQNIDLLLAQIFGLCLQDNQQTQQQLQPQSISSDNLNSFSSSPSSHESSYKLNDPIGTPLMDQSNNVSFQKNQFFGLCLDNQQQYQQQSITNDNLNNYFPSSTPSHGSSYKLTDPIGTVINQMDQTNNISLRKLKARGTEENHNNNINSIPSLNHPSNPITTSTLHSNGGSNSSRRKNRRGSCIECVFCKNNGQPASFYQSHVLKDVLGRVTCPILSAYDCPICHNGGGPKAHTVRYCPQNKPSHSLRNALLKSQTLVNTNQSIM